MAEIPEDTPRVDFRVETGARGILTWAEISSGEIARVSLEILNPARRLADQLETSVTTIICGKDLDRHATTLFEHGVDQVVKVEDDRLVEYRTLPYTRVFEYYVEEVSRPEIMLMGATTSGRELAPRIGSRIDAGVTADCTYLEVGDFYWRKKKTIMYPCLEAIRPSYGESKLATIVGFWCPQAATARAGTFPMPERQEGRSGEAIEIKPKFDETDWAVEIEETVRGGGGAEELFTADIVVSGGLPCGELDGFKLVNELVSTLKEQGLNAEWGASRMAVDNGFAPQPRQVGQTGKTIRPKVYVAVAISGKVQHLAGMKEAGKIIVINNDKDAPFYQEADVGIVRDYREVLPELIEAVKGGFKFGLQA